MKGLSFLLVKCLLLLQINHYEEVHAEVSRLEDWQVFDGWFRVDIRPFKMSLLNIIKKWSWMFKEHLMSYVTGR